VNRQAKVFVVPRVPQLFLRLVVGCTLALLAAHWFGQALVEKLLPLLKLALVWFANDFGIYKLSLVQQGPEMAVEAIAKLEHTIVLGGSAFVPNGRTGYMVTTTVGTVLQPLLTAFVLVLSWPGRWAEVAWRCLIALLLVVPMVLLDSPLYLAGSLWDMQIRAHAPGQQSPLVWWMGFLSAGGRLAIGLAAGALAVAVASAIAQPSRRVDVQG
jgi:hypothetical protein